MTIRERHHTSLDRAAAKKLVDALEGMIIGEDEELDLEDDMLDDVLVMLDKAETKDKSSITLEYSERVADHPKLARIHRKLLESTDEVEIDGARTSAKDFADKLAERYGEAWEAVDEEPLPVSMPRAGNGEKESKKVRRKLQEAVDDPFAGKRVATAMRAATPLVQKYAALLLEDDAQSDERAAKELGVATGEVTDARTALEALLAAAFREK
jgi:hypothetical protein